MPILLIGFLTLILCVYGLRTLGRASPTDIAERLRQGGGVAAALAAVLLLLRGQLFLATGLGGLSYYIFSGKPFDWRKWIASKELDWRKWVDLSRERWQARNKSRARTALLDMTLDLVTGEVDGEVLDGPLTGHKLSDLSQEDCGRFYRFCVGRDLETPRMLETYFDRRFAGWRPTNERDPNARDGEGRSGFATYDMTEQEAYEMLGLRSGASTQEIIQAHRSLMKERHPDHGGTTDDAARINQAKDRLLRRHG
jgi:hypothetical protein